MISRSPEQVVKEQVAKEQVANQVLDRCHSTNDIAKELGLNGFPHGTWVSSKVQDSGRGRSGRKWESEEGNLFLSWIVRIPDQQLWSWVPLTTAVAVSRCLRKLFPGLDIQIKWPNDLWLQGGKLGGILCEGFGFQSDPFIVIGLGLNCLWAPRIQDQSVSCLAAVRGGQQASPDAIRPSLIQAVLEEIQQLVRNGPARGAAHYQEWAVFQAGMEVEWNSHFGKVQGLGPSGELRILVADGSIANVFAEDVQIRKVTLKGVGEFPA